MKKLPTLVVVVVLLLSFVQRGESQDKGKTADGAISRLAPTVFSQLPWKIIRISPLADAVCPSPSESPPHPMSLVVNS